MEPETNGIRTWQWVVTVIIIIILIVLGYYMFKGNSAVAPVANENPVSTPTPETNSPVNRVVVSDQFPGNIVYVSSVQLDKPGFVVIKKDNAGTPGDVIGSQYFDSGINPGKITLTSATKEGGLYYAVLYTDTDGDKKFDMKKDMPINDSSGSTIMKPFRAASSVTEFKG